MTPMTNPQTREEMEARRYEAAKQFAAGKRQAEIAQMFKVSRTTASRWRSAWKAGRLKMRKASGRPPFFNWRERRDEIRKLYELAPPRARTTQGFADMIADLYDVRYDADHVGRILHWCGVAELSQPRRRRGARPERGYADRTPLEL